MRSQTRALSRQEMLSHSKSGISTTHLSTTPRSVLRRRCFPAWRLGTRYSKPSRVSNGCKTSRGNFLVHLVGSRKGRLEGIGQLVGDVRDVVCVRGEPRTARHRQPDNILASSLTIADSKLEELVTHISRRGERIGTTRNRTRPSSAFSVAGAALVGRKVQELQYDALMAERASFQRDSILAVAAMPVWRTVRFTAFSGHRNCNPGLD